MCGRGHASQQGVHGRGVCVAWGVHGGGGHAWPWRRAWLGACVAGGCAWQGACVADTMRYGQ